jgi:hypothetical protein
MNRYLNLKKYHALDRSMYKGKYKNRKNRQTGSNLRSQSRSDLSHLCYQPNTKWDDIIYVMPFQERNTLTWWDCRAYKPKIEGGGFVR